MNNNHETTKSYIYLLPTKNRRYFKLGKSSNGPGRITSKLNKIYSFDFKRCLIFFSERETVFSIETKLKNAIPMCKHVYGKADGSTEIREIRYFPKALAMLRENALTEHSFNEIFRTGGNEICEFSRNQSSFIKKQILKKIDNKKRIDFYHYAVLYASYFLEYYFDSFGYLNFEFIRDYNNHYKLISDKYIKMYTYQKGDKSRIVFILTYYDGVDIVLHEIFKTLCIYPSQIEKLEAAEKKQKSLNILKEQCVADYPLSFKDIINDELVHMLPSSIFNGLNIMQLSRIEDNFLLCYSSGVNQRIFYRDSVKYYQGESKVDKGHYFLGRFKHTQLLRHRCLYLNDERDEKYFWYCAKQYGIQLRRRRPRINTYGYET